MEIEIFTLADFAQDNSSKLTIVGTFDSIHAKEFPTQHPACSIACRLRFAAKEAGAYEFKLRLIDANGKETIEPITGNINIGAPANGQLSTINIVINFGPVVTLQSFKTEAEALQLANATQYGLAATIWTKDISKAHRMAAKVESGIIWINCWLLRDLRTPFGGLKNSGVGREGGWEALRFFTETKNICIDL